MRPADQAFAAVLVRPMAPEVHGGPAERGTRPLVLRFAPSPNGFLHLGHAYSALMNRRVARRLGGTLRLRFEDIDVTRCRPEYESAALADLDWLGVAFAPPVTRQSGRFDAYRDALGRLRRDGLTYPCFCTRGDIARAVADRLDWPRDPDGAPLYPGTCRHLGAAARDARLAQGVPAGLRLDMAAALARSPDALAWAEYREGPEPATVRANPACWGDVLLARKDVPTSYHVSVVVDDGAQGVTDVVRGEDLLAATSLHRLLQALLGLPAPRYHHHALIRDAAGTKLSKSHGAPSLRDLRLAGTTAGSVRAQLGFGPDDD